MINHNTTMRRVEWGGFFSLGIPKTWEFDTEDGVVNLFDEKNGIGVIQISFAKRKVPKEPTDQEAMEFAVSYAAQHGWSISTKSIHALSIGNSPATEFSVEENIDGEPTYWRVWHVMGKERVAFITYNCLASDRNLETEVCDLIIRSFSWC